MRTRFVLLAIGAYITSGMVLWAQTSGSDEARSSTDTTESQSSNINPTRTIQSHTQSGNRTLDSQSIQRRGPDGNFEPFQDIEKETVKVNATTVRTITRTFGRDADGARTLVQVTEEEKRSSPGGDSKLERSTSNPDANGRKQLVQREIEETKTVSKNVEETKTTVMLPGGNGDLAPAMQVQERRQQGANDTIESQKTTLLPDGNGNWQVGEVKRATIRHEGKTQTTDESVSRADSDGHLDEVSHTVSTEAEDAPGETRKTVKTYSADVPGTPRDGDLHEVGRKTTVQRTSPTGRQTTVQQVEQPNPGDPEAGLRVTAVTVDTVSPSSSGTRGTRTIEALDANDSLGVVAVDTKDSHSSPAVQVQIAPSENPK